MSKVHDTWRSDYVRMLATARWRARRDRVTDALLNIDRHASFSPGDPYPAYRNLNGAKL